MVEVRIHGRGGQDIVTASDLLAMVAFIDEYHVQMFPSFGSERASTPVITFCRVTETEICTREPALEPDVVVVQDPTLPSVMDVLADLKPEGYALLNSTKSFEELGLSRLVNQLPKGHATTLPIFDLTRGHVGRPVPSTVMLGGIAVLIGLICLQSVTDAIRHRFLGRVGDANVSAATAAYDFVVAGRGRVGSKEDADA